MGKYFNKNLEKWSLSYPREGVLLPYVDLSNWDWQEKPHLNLKGPLGLFHAKDPHKESLKWFKEIDLKDTDILVVWGTGLGYSYTAIKEWLHQKKKRRLVYFEEDLRVIHRLFETPLASELLFDPQVELNYLPHLDEIGGAIDTFYWSCVNESFQIACLPAYQKWDSLKFQAFHHKLRYDSTVKNVLVDEYLTFSVAFLRNFYVNILKLDQAYLGNLLFDKFRGVPAVITGAGPSLEKHFNILKKIDNKALFFAPGASLNSLSHHDVWPHLGAGIDPNSMQVMRLKTNKAYELPFFYRNRLHFEALNEIQGPRLYVTGAGGYDHAKFYEDKLKIPNEEIEEGHNVVNFLIQIATKLGCDPIILVGMDLAYTGMKTYAPGIVQEGSALEKEVIESANLPPSALLWKDQEGNPIYTDWKWLAEAKWISDFQNDHPQVQLINATEGGLGIKGITHMPFKAALKKYCKKGYDIRGRLHGEIQLARIQGVSRKKLLRLSQELKKSLLNCQKHLQTIYDEAEKALKKLQDPQHTVKVEESGLTVLAEMDLVKEPGYKYALDIYNEVYARMQNKNFSQIKQMKNPLKSLAQKFKLQQERVKFLSQVADVNITLIDWARKIK